MKERLIFLRDTEEARIWGDKAEECVCLQPGDVENLWKNREGESCFGFFFLFLHSQFRGTLGLLTSINVLLDPYVSTNSTHWKPHLAKDHRRIKSQVLPYLIFLVDLLPKIGLSLSAIIWTCSVWSTRTITGHWVWTFTSARILW